jgi:hypothetical protein
MASQQSGTLINLLLFAGLGTLGWFTAAWIKPGRDVRESAAPGKVPVEEVSASGSASQPGVFAADARRILSGSAADADAFEQLVIRYGTGSVELTALAAPFMDRWVERDAAGAASEGVTRALHSTPEILPRLFSKLGAAPSLPVDALLGALPTGPIRAECLTALAAARGHAGLELPAAAIAGLPRSERSQLHREWHRARAAAKPGNAESSAAALADPDDKAAAQAGALFARAAAEPELTLRASLTRYDFTSLAEAAFNTWIHRDAASAWNFAASLKDDPRLPVIAAHMLRVESKRRRFSDHLQEMTSLLSRLFPAGVPAETLRAFIPPLVAESPSAAQKYTDSLDGEPRRVATVILFDALCEWDPPTAWRLTTAEILKQGAKDYRTTHSWTSATERLHATPQQRLAAGFPDLADMIHLGASWLAQDPPAAINSYCAHGVPGILQRMIIESAVSPFGAAIPVPELMIWAKEQPDNIRNTIEGIVSVEK